MPLHDRLEPLARPPPAELPTARVGPGGWSRSLIFPFPDLEPCAGTFSACSRLATASESACMDGMRFGFVQAAGVWSEPSAWIRNDCRIVSHPSGMSGHGESGQRHRRHNLAAIMACTCTTANKVVGAAPGQFGTDCFRTRPTKEVAMDPPASKTIPGTSTRICWRRGQAVPTWRLEFGDA